MKFVKWPGSKARAASIVGPIVAEQLKGRKTLVIPFAGSLALTEWLYDNGHLDGVTVHANEFNPWLVNVWKCVRDPELAVAGVDNLNKLTARWSDNPPVGKDMLFDGVRMGLRRHPELYSSGYAAAMFLFFNRTCYNGLWRESKKSGLNTPIGKRSNGQHMQLPDWSEVMQAGYWIRDVDIHWSCGDFASFMAGLGVLDFTDTVVYADPPYFDTFVNYNANGFSLARQQQLVRILENLVCMDAISVLSNSEKFASYLTQPPWDVTLFHSTMSVSCAKDKGKLLEMVGVLK